MGREPSFPTPDGRHLVPIIWSCAQVIEWMRLVPFWQESLNSPRKHQQGAGSLLGVSSCYVHTALKLPCVGVLQPSVWGEEGSIQVLGQPWFIPSACFVLLSRLQGQLSKYHQSSGKHEFAHTQTHARARTPPCHRPLTPLTGPTPPYALSR